MGRVVCKKKYVPYSYPAFYNEVVKMYFTDHESGCLLQDIYPKNA